MSVFNPADALGEDRRSHALACVADARKRHKRDHDKAWKCEERRGSKEHRKGKGSAGQRQEWSPQDSNGGSAPPNLSDGEKKKSIKPESIWSADAVRIITRMFLQLPEKRRSKRNIRKRGCTIRR